jgi:3-hydroxyisobutyrate dehydrogenase
MPADKFNPPERIGFIGIGQMGNPMAHNLARAGFRLVIADANPDAVKRFAATVPCEAPPDLAALGRRCSVVITMLPDGRAVREVVLGTSGNGVAAGLGPASVLIDMSSSSPVGTRELGEELAARGIAFIDAPVSGGVKRARDGSLAIMVGGDEATRERCRPLFEALGKHVFATGPLGSGHAMKALNNYVSAAGFAAAAEAVVAGSRFGLDPGVIVNVINASSGRNNSTETKFAQYIFPRTFDSGFSLGLMVKDLRIALEVARASAMPAPLGEACLDVWSRAEQAVGGTADHTAVIQFWERLVAGSK